MSRIGRKPVSIPAGVSLSVATESFEVKGPKGNLSFPLFPEVTVKEEGGLATVELTGSGSTRNARARHGLVRAHLANMVEGVTNGYSITLEIQGTGWTAKPAGKGVELQIGFCHPVTCQPPEGVDVKVASTTEMVISGSDKHAVGQFAANVRRVRPPEPYKGKGIRYKDEQVRRKVGKSLG